MRFVFCFSESVYLIIILSVFDGQRSHHRPKPLTHFCDIGVSDTPLVRDATTWAWIYWKGTLDEAISSWVQSRFSEIFCGNQNVNLEKRMGFPTSKLVLISHISHTPQFPGEGTSLKLQRQKSVVRVIELDFIDLNLQVSFHIWYPQHPRYCATDWSSYLLEEGITRSVIFHPTGASLPGNFPRHPGVEANTPETLAFV